MRTLVTCLVFCAVGIGAFFLGKARGKTSISREANAIVVCNVPPDWGNYKGPALGGLVFEDSARTLRVVDCSSHSPIVAFEIRRR